MQSCTRTEALVCCFASAFVPISDENRDGGRAFPNSLESRLRFRVPARIALQGGERADADAILPLPFARKERFLELVWPDNCVWPLGISPANSILAGPPVHLRRQDTRSEAFLRNLLTITRKSGGVKQIFPGGRNFALRRSTAPTGCFAADDPPPDTPWEPGTTPDQDRREPHPSHRWPSCPSADRHGDGAR